MPTTNEQLQTKRDEADKLRDQLAVARAKRVQREALVSNDVDAALLDSEIIRLKAELAYEAGSGTASAVKDGVSDLLDAVKDEKSAAAVQLKAQEAANKEGS